jgi:hypothetical protein
MRGDRILLALVDQVDSPEANTFTLIVPASKTELLESAKGAGGGDWALAL